MLPKKYAARWDVTAKDVCIWIDLTFISYYFKRLNLKKKEIDFVNIDLYNLGGKLQIIFVLLHFSLDENCEYDFFIKLVVLVCRAAQFGQTPCDYIEIWQK